MIGNGGLTSGRRESGDSEVARQVVITGGDGAAEPTLGSVKDSFRHASISGRLWFHIHNVAEVSVVVEDLLAMDGDSNLSATTLQKQPVRRCISHEINVSAYRDLAGHMSIGD